MAKVTLVAPPNVISRLGRLGAALSTPPLGLAYLSAYAKRAGHGVEVIDGPGEGLGQCHDDVLPGTGLSVHGLLADEIVARIAPDSTLIGVSSMFSKEWIYQRVVIEAIAAAYPGKPLVIGGEHATAAADYILRTCSGVSACVLGEGEETLVDLLEALEESRPLITVPGLALRDERGAIVRTPARKRARKLDSLPWPDWESLPIRKYLDSGRGHGIDGSRNMPILASRGCPYECTFCSNDAMWGRLWNVRSPEDVVAEMKHYRDVYGATSYSFYDLTAIVRRSWIMRFTELLAEERLNVPWMLPTGTRSEAIDPAILRRLRDTGCTIFRFAPESGAPRTLALIKKRIDLERMTQMMRESVRAGLNTKANLILGFPGERRRDMLRTMLYAARLAIIGVHDVSAFGFSPYPGSVLFAELRTRGKLPAEDKDYDRFLATMAFDDYFHVRSWNDKISSAQLRALLAITMITFNGLKFMVRPWRLVQSLANVARGRPVTIFERVLTRLLLPGSIEAAAKTVEKLPPQEVSHRAPNNGAAERSHSPTAVPARRTPASHGRI